MLRWATTRLRDHATAPLGAAPPNEHVDRVLYGLARPWVGVRILLSSEELLRAALFPSLLLAATCVAWSLILPGSMVVRFYKMMVFLAPVPSLFFAAHYARLAADARRQLGFGDAQPCIEPIFRAVRRVIARAVLIAIAVAPLALLENVPLVGPLVWKAVGALWALHWIVVDAFDSARVLEPGQTLADVDAEVDALPSPWFVQLMLRGAAHLPSPFRGLAERFARLCDRLARPWRDELQLVAAHPSLVAGFAISTACLLAIPILNVFFRPIILVAAVQVLGRHTSAAEPLDEPKALPAAGA